MATKNAPIRRRRVGSKPAKTFSATYVNAWIGLVLSIIALGGWGYDKLQGGWKRDQEQQQTATALTLLKTETDTKIATTKSDLSDRLTKVEARAEGIDKTGTEYGRSQYSSQAVERQQIKKEVQDLQDVTRELAPAVTEIKANVRWLMANAGAPDAVSAAQSNPRPRPRSLRSRN